MEKEISDKFNEQDNKLDKIYHSIERMRKYFLWTLVVTIVTIVVPLIALIFIVPWSLKVFTSIYSI